MAHQSHLRVLGIATTLLTNLHQQIVEMHSHMFLNCYVCKNISGLVGFQRGVFHSIIRPPQYSSQLVGSSTTHRVHCTCLSPAMANKRVFSVSGSRLGSSGISSWSVAITVSIFPPQYRHLASMSSRRVLRRSSSLRDASATGCVYNRGRGGVRRSKR